jgi:hypothetical protein
MSDSDASPVRLWDELELRLEHCAVVPWPNNDDGNRMGRWLPVELVMDQMQQVVWIVGSGIRVDGIVWTDPVIFGIARRNCGEKKAQ